MTFARNISREEERIDWTKGGKAIYDQIRGLHPWPVAYTVFQGENVKIWWSEKVAYNCQMLNQERLLKLKQIESLSKQEMKSRLRLPISNQPEKNECQRMYLFVESERNGMKGIDSNEYRPKKKIWNGNVRDAALSILMEINNNQAYSNLLLHRTIEKYDIEAKDRGLIDRINIWNTSTSHGTRLLSWSHLFVGNWMVGYGNYLRMSLYQIVYLTKIPPHAVVHEAVEIAKRRGHKRIAPTVNGIFRSVLRKGVRSLDELEDGIAKIAIETSHPEWLIKRWIEQYGEEEATVMAHENNNPPAMTIRVNTAKTTIDEAIAALEAEGIEVRKGEVVQNA